MCEEVGTSFTFKRNFITHIILKLNFLNAFSKLTTFTMSMRSRYGFGRADPQPTIMALLSLTRVEHIRLLISTDNVPSFKAVAGDTCRDLGIPEGEFLQEFCFEKTNINILHIAAAWDAVGKYLFALHPILVG